MRICFLRLSTRRSLHHHDRGSLPVVERAIPRVADWTDVRSEIRADRFWHSDRFAVRESYEPYALGFVDVLTHEQDAIVVWSKERKKIVGRSRNESCFVPAGRRKYEDISAC